MFLQFNSSESSTTPRLAQGRPLFDWHHTIEDTEDARTIERAKRANGNRPRIPWVQVKKELQLD